MRLLKTVPPRWGIWVLVLLMLAVAGGAHAQPEDDPSPHSEAELVAAVRHVQPGAPFTVALRLEMEKGWHSYWKNPGDSGQPTSIDWDLPEGFEASAIQWPYPHRIAFGPLTSYGYSDEVLLLVDITPPAELPTGTDVALEGRANWLICADICLPATAQLSLTLPVRSQAPPASPEGQAAIEAARALLPEGASGWHVSATRSEGSYALQITPPGGAQPSLEGAYFYPAEKGVIAHAAPQPVSLEDGTYVLALQQSGYAQEPADSLRGVLVAPEGVAWDAEGRVRALAVDVAVAAPSSIARGAAGASMTLWWALLLAFAGGLLLNLMPCVFPVLSIKVLGFARQAGEDRTGTWRHGATFGAGVLVSFWVLAGALLALRAAGSEIGWGFQLQSPVFVALMAMLFFGIGLNLMGLFGVGTALMRLGGRAEQQSPAGYGGSFSSGVLATVVATPCTAPLMGAALGFALTRPATEALLVFSMLGLGMAAPYVALSMAPGLLKRLPRPGPWMETLRQVLAFPMFGAAVWLVWVFGRQTGTGGMALLLLALLLLSMAGWLLRRWGAQAAARTRLLARGLAVLVAVGALGLALAGARHAPPSATAAGQEGAAWQPFSTEKVEALRRAGRPVFVDFTAAWCLTCQVNKRTTLSAPAVQEAFARKGVALLRADWTNRDPDIARALEALGRSGVPVYALYKGSGADPVLLPEILTEDIVLEALRGLPARQPAAPEPEPPARTAASHQEAARP